ncbi:MAG: hypothetical protein A2045_14470 [Rhodocyclales bacterium GWA2_65_20]|nr:MAG: hypothetical protein A2045_14470 [Rhodocyclales bacterium GWA2_65_20]
MHPNLSFEQAPPISVPYRFFVTAPWFGVAAGLVLAWLGSDALVSRWTPGALAVTHLLVTGFMLQAMCGALLQFVPVAAGGNVWRPATLAMVVHPLLAVAALLLATAFLTAKGFFFMAAAHIFAVAIGSYVVVVGFALRRTPAQGPTLMALRLAVVGLAVTATLGITLATSLGSGRSLPLIEITQVHAAWGLGGWALMLVIGVSYFVVPMFQLTPPYPARFAWALPPAMILVLTLWSWQLGGTVAAWQKAVLFVGILLAAAYAAVTLILQSRRRRKVTDPTLFFFRGAMASLLLIAASNLWFAFDADAGADPRATVWIGLLAIPGVFVSVISGMLYKIMPFLNWLHLQRLCGLGLPPPNMRNMISEQAMFGQMRLHFAALAALLLAVPLPLLTRPAGLLFAASCAWLGYNLAGGVRAYRRFRDQILASGASQGS